ncbi:MAG: DUF3137 domain-containing protein [Eubacteriaceae bacterium]
MGLFGKSKKEVWNQLSNEINADMVDGGFWKGNRVEARHNQWTIYLDTYTVSTGKSAITYTRMRAPFVDKDGFNFKIYKKGVFSDIGKMFGMQDIEVGFEEFDENYIIQGNNEYLVKKLFSSYRIRQLIQKQPKIRLEIKKSEGIFGPAFTEEERELHFLVVGVIKDIELLKSLFELFSETLEELKLMGSASDDLTNVELY